MRSRTSRGVPEWSGGEELYIGSPVSATWKVSGVTGIVPGPPKGSRGSTGWGHLSRRAPWAEVGKGTSPWWAGAPPLGPPAPRVGNPRGGGAPHLAWGASSPLAPPLEMGSLGGRCPPGPLYKEGGGLRTPAPGASLSLRNTSASRRAWRSPAEIAATSTTTSSCCWISINLSLPLAGSRRRRRLPNCTCVERGGAVSSALGSPVIWITTSTTPSTPFS